MTQPMKGKKLIVTIVRKEKAKKIIQATKDAGARGGTTLLGKGFRVDEKTKFLGIPVERERAILLTLVSSLKFTEVMNAIIDTAQLNKPRHGIGFVIDTKNVTGICKMLGYDLETNDSDEEGLNIPMEEQKVLYDLIVTIVNRGDSEQVVEASKKAGAEGGTIINGRGTGVHEKAKLFNILIEPEKEVILTLISRDKTSDVLAAIEDDAELKKPGKGIAFVMQVEQTVGINHLLNKMVNDKFNENN
ncbi:P-II family nitrogen regulator [Ornithinibacillus halophilus]|uniref:Nitrogen regulatory protein P-II family n=1 Tax=Ornithinibacillus halophilus TaxID=930117 RepID=A0A1M5GDY4_9BACI|nr:P-II family nitrogen regulator [Ornithinibacillus halophilus]SHG01947.1 nitrogen regulatory protein P-II family [Ornithinibacillus halophilus]